MSTANLKNKLLQEKLFYFAYLDMAHKSGKMTDEILKIEQDKFVEELKRIEALETGK